MSVEHKNISRDNIHEPKGIENASFGDVYIADSQGSGEWSSALNSLIGKVGTFTYTLNVDNLDFSGQKDFPVPVHLSSNLVDIYGSVSEDPGQTVTVVTKIAGSNVVNGSLTFNSSTTAKTPLFTNTTGNTLVSQGEYVDVQITSAATAAGQLVLTLVFEVV